METFEPGIKCPWTGHTFSINENGMKCTSCPRVIKLSAWQEKRQCYCGNTNLVEAIARISTPTQISKSTRLQFRPTANNPAVSSPNRTIRSSPQSISSTTPSRPTNSSPSYSSTDNSLLSGCGCLALFLISILMFGTCTAQVSQQSRPRATQQQRSPQSQSNSAPNNSNWNFPKSACGDSNPPGLQDFYPVFVNRTDESVLQYIKTNYCRDAYLMTRSSVNQRSIQVASFRSKERAFEFAQIMHRDPRINSAEVGSPSPR